MKKIISLLLIFVLLPIVNAQQTIQINKGIDQSWGIIHDLFDVLPERVQLLFTQDKFKRVELRIKFLGERLQELENVANNKPKFIPNALTEVQAESNNLANEAEITPKPIKERVETGLENSKNILLSLKTRFEEDDNINNDNAIQGLETAISSHITAIDRIDSRKR